MKKTETEITFNLDEFDNLIRLVYKNGISDGNVMSITGDFEWTKRDEEAADWWDRNRDEFLA